MLLAKHRKGYDKKNKTYGGVYVKNVPSFTFNLFILNIYLQKQ